jgi:hypothetical protein
MIEAEKEQKKSMLLRLKGTHFNTLKKIFFLLQINKFESIAPRHLIFFPLKKLL